jgi:hypothetical protein
VSLLHDAVRAESLTVLSRFRTDFYDCLTARADELFELDAGYDAPRIAPLLSGLPVEVLGRTRSDRVMRRPAPSREEFLLANPKGGRPPKHGGEFVFGDPSTWGEEQAVTVTDTRLYGKAIAQTGSTHG